MAISNKRRQEYINWLYSKKEQKQIKESVLGHRLIVETYIEDYLLLDEENRILKKHFKLTNKEASKIVQKYRLPSKGEEKLLKLLR